MIKIRLLKKKQSTLVFMKLEEIEIPDLVSINEMTPLMFAIGSLLSNYSETLTDPNIVNFLVDSTITNWTVADLESIQANLLESNMELLITNVDADTPTIGAGDATYLVVNKSIMQLGFLASEVNLKVDPNKVDLVAVFKSLIAEYNYFTQSKFKNNPLTALIAQLEESFKLYVS